MSRARRSKTAWLAALWLATVSVAPAASAQTAAKDAVDLVDGTHLEGTIVEMQKGAYLVIETAPGQRQTLPWTRVKSVGKAGATPPPSSTTAPAAVPVPSAPATPPPVPPAPVAAGDDVVVMRSGARLEGKILVKKPGQQVTIKTAHGIRSIPWGEVKEVIPAGAAPPPPPPPVTPPAPPPPPSEPPAAPPPVRAHTVPLPPGGEDDFFQMKPLPTSAVRSPDDVIHGKDASIGRVRNRVPKVALEAYLRPSYETWLAGSIGPTSMGSLWSPSLGAEIGVGVRFAARSLLYLGWQHVPYGVGSSSPYANLPAVSSWGDAYLVGYRWLSSTSLTSLLLDFSLGYSNLQQQATDSLGNSASVSIGSPLARVGLGASIRPLRWFALEPTAALVLTSNSSASTSQVVGGQSTSSSGNVPDSGAVVALSLGVGGAFDLPLSEE